MKRFTIFTTLAAVSLFLAWAFFYFDIVVICGWVVVKMFSLNITLPFGKLTVATTLAMIGSSIISIISSQQLLKESTYDDYFN